MKIDNKLIWFSHYNDYTDNIPNIGQDSLVFVADQSGKRIIRTHDKEFICLSSDQSLSTLQNDIADIDTRLETLEGIVGDLGNTYATKTYVDDAASLLRSTKQNVLTSGNNIKFLNINGNRISLLDEPQSDVIINTSTNEEDLTQIIARIQAIEDAYIQWQVGNDEETPSEPGSNPSNPGTGGTTSNGGTVTSVALSVPTGLQVSGSPITSSGTLAVTYATGYSIPTTQKQSEWDQAYSWGNHEEAHYLTQHQSLSGYATESWVTSQIASAQLSGGDNPIQLAAVATSGDYDDLINKPSLFSGSYNDLTDKPTIPTVNNGTLTIKQDNITVGTFTANSATDVTVNLTSGSTLNQKKIIITAHGYSNYSGNWAYLDFIAINGNNIDSGRIVSSGATNGNAGYPSGFGNCYTNNSWTIDQMDLTTHTYLDPSDENGGDTPYTFKTAQQILDLFKGASANPVGFQTDDVITIITPTFMSMPYYAKFKYQTDGTWNYADNWRGGTNLNTCIMYISSWKGGTATW